MLVTWANCGTNCCTKIIVIEGLNIELAQPCVKIQQLFNDVLHWPQTSLDSLDYLMVGPAQKIKWFTTAGCFVNNTAT